MTHDAELMLTQSTTEPVRFAAAERMRRHRERRRDGLRCLTIELRETEIAALVRMGPLESGGHEFIPWLRTQLSPRQNSYRIN